jgi:ankyrin repeat protein
MRKAVWCVISLAFALSLFGCGKSKDQAVQGLATLNLKFSADDFVRSAAQGDGKALPLFLEAGIDLNAPNSEGYTGLMAAAEKGRSDVVKQLLDHRADVNVKGREGLTALMLAGGNDHPDVVKLLLDHKADPSVQDDNGWTAMMKAVYQGNTACVRLLANRSREDVNRGLLLAALMGRKDTLQALFDYGAEVDTRAEDGRTALMMAASKGYNDIVAVLLKAGADPSLTDPSGASAEAMAASKGFSEIASSIQQAPPRAASSGNRVAAVSPAPSSGSLSDKDLLTRPTPSRDDASQPIAGGSVSDNKKSSANEPAAPTPLSSKLSVVEIAESFLPITLVEVQDKTARIQTGNGETYRVSVGEQLKDLDYKVVDVEARNVNDKDGNPVDASAVKLRQLKTGETISLIKGIPAREKGSYVVLRFPNSSETLKVELDQTFTIPGEPDHSYKLLDIRPSQVVIRRDDDRVWTLQK